MQAPKVWEELLTEKVEAETNKISIKKVKKKSFVRKSSKA